MIGVIGLSHKSAPVQIREKFSFTEENSKKLASDICRDKYIDSVLILSTCNRTEIYFRAINVSGHVANLTIIKYLAKFTDSLHCQKEYFYHYEHQDAVKHLFRVVCSLDSMVLGEYQIVSQVKSAVQLAESNGTIKSVLKRLFNKALEASKLVRTTTDMSTGAFSISYAAVELCINKYRELSQKNILLIGAGETGELVVRSLYKKGVNQVAITNRTALRSEELAKRYNAKSVAYSNLKEHIQQADIIISAVGAEEPIITKETININIHQNKLFIDLGVPRNINVDISEIKNVDLINVDDLQQVVDGNQDKKKQLITTAELIIDDKVDEFLDWLSGRNLSPAIQKIIHTVHQIQKSELETFSKNKNEEEIELMKEVTKHMSEKIVNKLIVNLKELSDNGRHSDYIKIVKDLFDSNEK